MESVVSELLDALTGLRQPVLAVVAGLLAFAECSIGLGVVVPGEAGVLVAALGVDSVARFVGLFAAVAVGAALGDTVGYLLGRRYGAAVRNTRLGRRVPARQWDAATRMLDRHGPAAVFVARWMPVARAALPVTAGMGGLAYRRFWLPSAASAVLWSAVHVGLGALAASSAHALADKFRTVGWVLLAALVVAGTVVFLVKRRPACRGRHL